jgi:hypothetical protein
MTPSERSIRNSTRVEKKVENNKFDIQKDINESRPSIQDYLNF